MAGLEGTVKTPLGAVQKKTALLLVGSVVILGGIVYYRQKQLGGTDVAPTDAPINPATGYPYGSPEDAAALQAQAGYASPTVPGTNTGGSGSIPPSNLSYSTNSQWVQAVVEYMVGIDPNVNSGALTTALGKYTTGGYVTDGEVSLIQQAIAVQGFPPIAGPTGYPPSINRNPPTTTPKMVAPTGLKALRVDKNGVKLDWNPVTGAKGYKMFANGVQVGSSIVYSTGYLPLAKQKTKYNVGVAGIFAGDKTGPMASISVTTK